MQRISHVDCRSVAVRRVLFLLDRSNLGLQAKPSSSKLITPAENRQMSELYGIQRLSGGNLRSNAKIDFGR